MLDSSLLIFIQIVSESFPVSSSGHSALAACVIAYYHAMYGALGDVFVSSSSMLLAHIPTIFIIMCFFRTTWMPLVLQLPIRRRIIMHLILYTCIADCITVGAYVVVKFFSIAVPLSFGFAITAALLFSLRWCNTGTTRVAIRHMIVIGIVQSVALLPGISRFGAVYGVCRWLGVRSTKAFGVAWMLQWPLMVAGTLLGTYEQIAFGTTMNQPSMSALFFVSCIAYAGLYSMYWCAQKNLLWIVSIYMFIPLIISCIMRC